MYYQREHMSTDRMKSTEHSETGQVHGCLGRLFLLVRDIAVLEAFSQ
jgi:hypothetical protein